MAPLRSACIAAKANATDAESSTLGAADPLDDQIAKLKTYLAATLEHVQLDSIKTECGAKVPAATNSILETVQADLQLQAASNTTALTTQSTIQLRLSSLEVTVEQGERIRRSTSMTVKGVSPASTSAHRHITALVHHLLAQHAIN